MLFSPPFLDEEVHRGHPTEPDQPQHLRLPGQDLPADPQEEVPDQGLVLLIHFLIYRPGDLQYDTIWKYISNVVFN